MTSIRTGQTTEGKHTMKISKRELRKIIREEKSKIINEGLPSSQVPYRIQDGLDSFGYRMAEELNGMLYQLDSNWHDNAEVYAAVRRMLENIKSEYMSGS